MNAEKHTLLHKLLWALVPYNGLVALIALVDFVMHPMALSPYAPFGGAAWFRAFCVLAAPLYFVLFYLVQRRSPGNLVGLLMLSWGGGAASFGVSVEIAPLLLAIVSLLIGVWWTSIIIFPYYFPDGRAYPRWIHPFLTALMFGMLIFGFVSLVSQPTLAYKGGAPNPLYVPAIAVFYNPITSLLSFLFLPLIIGVFIAPIRRYLRANYKERQQLKWLMFFALGFTAYLIVYLGAGLIYQELERAPAWVVTVYNLYLPYIVLFPALAVGNAILRHNLYDIDIIIRRTLVYSVLSVILAAIYFGGVILTQQLLRAIIGQSGGELGIVLSTLLIAALFSPLRRRIQDIIDRRFYRRKYDAEQTLAHFNQTLRDEVDIETLKAQLVGVVNDTMQPTKVALWIPEK
jgi:hypothetical protein